jgi:outer membrane protein assembly factor BamB
VLSQPNTPDQLIIASSAGIASYSVSDGKENWIWNWKWDGKVLRTVMAAFSHQGMLFVGGGDGGGSRLFIAIKDSGKGDVTANNLVWEKSMGTPYMPNILGKDKYLFWVNDLGIATCVEAKTGTEIWSERLDSAKAVSSSPVMVNNHIYVVSETGMIYVLEPKDKYKLVAKYQLGPNERVFATPAIADGLMYIRGKDSLYCIGKK